MTAEPRKLLGTQDLAPVAELDQARGLLEAYSPADENQSDIQRRMIEFVARHPRTAHLRSNRQGHLTASAMVLSNDGSKALLVHHRKLERWLQVGGHCDGDANLPHVALREAEEETGIADLRIDPRPIDLDIHTIPARKTEPEHLHLDTRFFAWAPAGAQPVGNHESHDIRWFDIDQPLEVESDDSVERLFALARSLPTQT